jgi:predicted PurR-regulated permease PerM
LGFVLNLAGGVFIPLVIAWFTLQIFRPIINLGKKIKLPMIANLIMVFAVFLGICYIGSIFCIKLVYEFGDVYKKYDSKLNVMIENILIALQIIPNQEFLHSEFFNWKDVLNPYLRNISQVAFAISSKFILILIFFMFMLMESPFLNNKIDRAFSNDNAAKIKNIMFSVSCEISNYLGTITLISLVTGFSAWAILAFVGVELAAGWGVLTFLLNFIPTVGSIIATILPVMMAILQFSPSFVKPVVVLISVGAMQFFLGNFITPKMVGDRLGLSPVVILLSLLLWGMIWGIPGAILSVPIAAIIKIVCENFEPLKPIAVIIGSGKSLTLAPPKAKPETQEAGKQI